MGLTAPSQHEIPRRARRLIRRGEEGGQEVRLRGDVGRVVDNLKRSQPQLSVHQKYVRRRVDPQRLVLSAEAKRRRPGAGGRGNRLGRRGRGGGGGGRSGWRVGRGCRIYRHWKKQQEESQKASLVAALEHRNHTSVHRLVAGRRVGGKIY